MKNVLITAGEPSGDLHASNLVKDLKSLDPNLKFFGLGGNLMKGCGVDTVFDITALALIGLVEVWKNIFTVGRAYRSLLKRIDSEHVDLAILVDYPGFNLRLAKELKERSIPVVYYISPQVWAWAPERIDIIKACVKKMVVFFKFEEELYKKHGVNVECVGHPLVDTIKVTAPRDDVRRKYSLDKEKTVIALLPGSRKQEVRALLKIMAEAARLINKRLGNTRFIVAKHPDLPLEIYKNAVKDLSLDIKIAEADTYNVLGASDFAIVASGTATLETAMIGTPFLIAYRVNLFTYIVYKFVAKTRFVGLVNVMAAREVVPELLQFNATPEKIAQKTVEVLSDKKRLSNMREEFGRVRSSLGGPGASFRAAKSILPLLK